MHEKINHRSRRDYTIITAKFVATTAVLSTALAVLGVTAGMVHAQAQSSAKKLTPAQIEQQELEERNRVLEKIAKMAPARIGNKAKAAAKADNSGDYKTTNRIDLSNVNDTKWESIGPYGFRIQRTGALGQMNSIAAGRVFGVAYDPQNPNIVFAATAGGGLWRFNPQDTTPAVNTYPWRPLGDKFPSLVTNSVTVSPFNSKVILVGTNSGVMRSINGGNTFVNVGGLGRVTSIVVDPDNPNWLYATSGQRIVFSRDLGNTWSDIAPPTEFEQPVANPPKQIGEEWNHVVFSMRISPTGPQRYMYATSRRGGLYISQNRGGTWRKASAPLKYNPVNLNANDPFAGRYGIDVAVSPIDPGTVYVADSNGAFSDGKIFKSTNGGATWTEITGDYPVQEGTFNSWTLSQYALSSLVIPALQPDATGTQLIQADLLLTATAFPFSSPLGGRDWNLAGPSPAPTHRDQHGLSYTNANPNRVMVANDGGIYEMTLNPSTGQWTFNNNTINKNLVASELFATAFHPTQPGFTLGGTLNNGPVRSLGTVTDWTQIAGANGPFSNAALLGELPTGTTGGSPSETIATGTVVTNVAYDRAVPNVQYMTESGSGRIFVTTSNWSTGWEITPSRTIHNSSGNPLRVNGTPLNAFPQVNAQATDVATNWSGERHSPNGILVSDPIASNQPSAVAGARILYSAGQYLWRYDLLPGFAQAVNVANVDRGYWRRVGDTNLADEAADAANNIPAEYITAVAVAETGPEAGSRIYVGTNTGRLWMTRNARQVDATTPVPKVVATWQRIDNATLPSRLDLTNPTRKIRRAITAISVNPANPSSDILVGVSGAGLFRCANTIAGDINFTAQNGANGSVSALPTTEITAIARDTVTLLDPNNPNSPKGDADNSWFVGTPTGVFSTNNQGSSWTDATIPLGLPLVPITSLDVNSTTGFMSVGTFGRGSWRFNLGTAKETVLSPKLSIKYALSRNGGTIYANVTVENATTAGQARDVKVVVAQFENKSRANLVTNGFANETLMIQNNPPTLETFINPDRPVNLGVIGTGPASAQSTTIVWPTAAGRTGDTVTLKFKLTGSNFDPADKGEYSFSTRLP